MSGDRSAGARVPGVVKSGAQVRQPPLAARLAAHVLVYGVALTMLVPFAWMVITSLKTPAEANARVSLGTLLPDRPVFENYAAAVTDANLDRFYLNSLVVAVVTTVLAVAHNALAGYAFAKLRFRGKRVGFALTLATMMLPAQCFFIFAVIFASRLDLYDNLQAMIVPFLASGFGVFYMRQAITSVPDSIIEAGRIDGMRELDLFWAVVRPLTWPAISALAIFTFVNSWNNFFWPLVVIDSERFKTLPLAVAELQSGLYVQSYPVVMAATTLLVLPLICVFFLLQRAFVRGLTLGGVKD